MIRAGTGSDCARFAALHAASFDPPWDATAFQALLASPGVAALTSDAGFIVIRVAADEAEVITVTVAADARRAGEAQKLLGAAVEKAKAAGAGRLFLEVSAENLAARALYARQGFVQVGHRIRYYADGSDALVLALTLA